MKFTLSWLKEHLDTDADVATICETLTAIGLEVESVDDASTELADFTVAEILEAEQHPDADKLRVCKVHSAEGELQIVCGAPNARAGIKVALAKIGTRIPNGDFKIKKSKIRGVESCGMLCSASELNLGSDGAGIIELPADAEVGAPLATALGLDDPVIDIAITPNRGDCLGVYGIARDLAAAGLGRMKPLPEYSMPEAGVQMPLEITTQTESCQQFIGIYIEGVTNGSSPDWLQQKLRAVGLRPISALVDITNYMTMAYGRPLHVYDVDKLNGSICARTGQQGETFDALNDETYTLKGGECVIADEAGVLGLGGIIGGTSSGVSDETTRVLLECAWFEPEAIAKAGREHGIDSDARYRFERFVDSGFMHAGAAIATRMILDVCGGQASKPQSAGELAHSPASIAVTQAHLAALTGVAIGSAEQQRILNALGFTVTQSGEAGYTAQTPSWRPDVTQQADIAEEILRIWGYDRVEAVALPKLEQISPPALSAAQQRESDLRRALAMRGLHECVHWAFCDASDAKHFGETPEALQLLNPIASDLNQMRPSLLPHLLHAISRNHARGQKRIGLFEIGASFFDTSMQGQRSSATVVRAGLRQPQQWMAKKETVDCFDAKADALAGLAVCGVDTNKCQVTPNAPEYYHPGRSGAISLGPKNILAYFGELHPMIAEAFDVNLPVMVCELFLDAIPQPKRKAAQPLKVSDYQSSTRDFAFVTPKETLAGELTKAITKTAPELIRSVELFDVYEGKELLDNTRSLAISVKLQADDRTLTDQEIDKVAGDIIAVAEKLGARLRA